MKFIKKKSLSNDQVSNLNGNYQPPQGPHTNKGNSATLGRPKGEYKKDSTDFTKKKTGTMGRSEVPPSLAGELIQFSKH